MASGSAVVSVSLLFLLVAAVICMPSPSAAAASSGSRGWKVGGRTVVSDVRENKEVQDLGRFAVREHNRRLGPGARADRRLVFGGVVGAERQVVSGIKYYLQIVAVSDQEAAVPGSGHLFDAVVVVKAWLGSKDLLSFSPSSSNLRAVDGKVCSVQWAFDPESSSPPPTSPPANTVIAAYFVVAPRPTAADATAPSRCCSYDVLLPPLLMRLEPGHTAASCCCTIAPYSAIARSAAAAAFLLPPLLASSPMIAAVDAHQ
ncbi:hypothetical protein Taro_051916 [Colocasia esculenta]|uniref:Cystatin domain-containing protein n=1 Tax=Colocasia esculenta TaxID=4460 RepID=A0A843XHU5_COLES|nr:hypothetical protein [Colocasia esculenta]